MRHITAALALAISVCPAIAQIALSNYLTDNMVVQRNATLKIKGSATGEVCVSPSWDLSGRYCASAGTDSLFSITIPTPEAGGPFTITISDSNGNTKILKDIYSGEVWLCSGQSNMEMPLAGWGRVNNYEKEIADAVNYPQIHLLQIGRLIAAAPQETVAVNNGGWRKAAPENLEYFSSVAYFFARELTDRLGDIPVGVIDCSWGGTPGEAWTSLESCREVGFDCSAIEANASDSKLLEDYKLAVREWYAVENASDTFNYSEKQKGLPQMYLPKSWNSTELSGFDGIVWFQREVKLPKEMTGKDLYLSLGKIDDYDYTYVNGSRIGETWSCTQDRFYKIPASLAGDRLLVSVRVTDTGGDGGFVSEPEYMYVTDGTTTLPLRGEWGYCKVMDYGEHPQPTAPYSQHSPSSLFNAMVYPLRNIDIAGTIWYQGCNNVGRAEEYSRLFPRLITDWRALFGETMPFYFVQLAGYLAPQAVQPDSEWAALRQAQTAALALPNTAMATAVDIGESYDIHPKNKQEVARRLALNALNKTYHLPLSCEAPEPESFDYTGNTATVVFNGTIVNIKDYPKGFIVRNSDGEWSRPHVRLENNVITLSATKPITEIKYNWADFPDGNLYGQNGLPVLPFENKK